MTIRFISGYVLNYEMICEENSKEDIKFQDEDLGREFFNQNIENENLTYISHKTNSLLVKNKETFIFQAKKEYYKIYIKLLKLSEQKEESYYSSECYRVKPREDETKFEVEVLFNDKGKYFLEISLLDILYNDSIYFEYYLIFF